MKVMYACGLCNSERFEVEVNDRGQENVVQWMELVVTPALVLDHEMRSPGCKPSVFKEVLIPVPDGTEAIGKPVKN